MEIPGTILKMTEDKGSTQGVASCWSYMNYRHDAILHVEKTGVDVNDHGG